MLGSILGALPPSPFASASSAIAEKDEPLGAGTPTTASSSSSVSVASSGVSTLEPSRESWQPPFTSPPPVNRKYKQENALDDLPGGRYAVQLFLESKMQEAEEFCSSNDPNRERLYFATGFGLIQCAKGLLSYEDEDIVNGIKHTKHGNQVADLHRKKQAFLGSRVAGYVVSAIHSNPVAFIKTMTPVERHAELVYAESLIEKAMLGIVYSGDWLAFIKEALNMRTTITIYTHLNQYLSVVDTEARARARAQSSPSPDSPSPSTPASFASSASSMPTYADDEDIIDESVDADFRSGVYLGIGMINIILSLMPAKLAAVVEIFGYHGDRAYGLEMLGRAGGWKRCKEGGDGEPGVTAADEGIRRPICDLALLTFHLFLSSFTFAHIDVPLARHILTWNLRRFPTSVFFLFAAGRLKLLEGNPTAAIEYYVRSMDVVQGGYGNLRHAVWWEVVGAWMSLWEKGSADDYDGDSASAGGEKGSLVWWRKLEKEATWSRAVYTYGLAVNLWEVGVLEWKGSEEARKRRLEEVVRLMKKVPELRQKIAGKSIPLEKFVARKARKFLKQDNRLALPLLEIAYIFQGIPHAPRAVLEGKMLVEVEGVLTRLEQEREGAPEDGAGSKTKRASKIIGQGKSESKKLSEGHWDDYCLARFLQGVCLRYVAYPDPDTVDAEHSAGADVQATGREAEEAARKAEEAFRDVFKRGPLIELDHQVVYQAHYELGRLLACQGKIEEARKEFELVLSGKYLEVGPSGRKGRYSLENVLHVRTHAANEALGDQRRL